MLQITSAKITAPIGAGGWVQIQELSPSNLEDVGYKGRLFVVVSSKKGREGIEAIEFERKIISGICDEYYNNVQEKPFDALKNATQNIANEFGEPGEDLEIASVVYAGDYIYTSAFGGSKIIIGRGGSLASILESGKEVITASGSPFAGDVMIAGTKAFFEKVDLSTLGESLQDRSPESAVEKITSFIYTGAPIDTAGAIILKFEEENDKNLQSEISDSPKEPPITKQTEIKEKLLGFWGRFKTKIPRRNIYIKPGIQDEATSHSRKLTLSIGIILLVILAASVGLGIRQKKVNSLKKEYQGLLTEATAEINQAIGLASTSPEESRNLFLDSEGKLEKIKLLKVKDPKIDELQKIIEDSRAAILGEFEAAPELFIDLGLLSSGLKGDSLSFSGGNVYVLDKEGNRIVSVALATKKSEIVAGPTLIDNPSDIASYEDEAFVILSDGIYSLDSRKTKVIEKSWNGEAFLYSFAGNLYILDKAGNAIYRYAGNGDGTYGSQQNWLSSSTNADFANAKAWSMNGAIYVLYPNSKILKYSQGSPQNFSLRGIIPEIGNVDAFFADSDNQYVYLLDRAGKRVVAVDKDGRYKSQYIGDQISEAVSLIVSEADKKIILLTGGKLLSIELKGI